MPRQPRIDYPGAWHHVINRGRNRQAIVRSDADCELFLQHLNGASRMHDIEIHAFALMGNHYHLLVRSRSGRLSTAMQYLGGRYTQDINDRHELDGALFKGRYFSKLIDNERYLRESARYIVNNPVKAGLVRMPEQFQWSSYPATMGIADPPPFLHTTWLVETYFDGDLAAFDAFVRRSDSLRSQIFAKTIESPTPEPLMSASVAPLEKSIRRLDSLQLRQDGLQYLKDAVVSFVCDRLQISLVALIAFDDPESRTARMLLLTLLHEHEVAGLDHLCAAFDITSAKSARRYIQRFKHHTQQDPDLLQALEQGLDLYARTG